MSPQTSYAQMHELIARLAFATSSIGETNSYYTLTPSQQLSEISKRVARLEAMVSDFAGLSFEARQMITHGGKTYGSIKRPKRPVKTNTVTV